MKTTIDKAGRVVIPSSIRRRAALTPGTRLDIEFDNGAISITRDIAGPVLVRRKGRLVAEPKSPGKPLVNLDEWVDEERNRWPI